MSKESFFQKLITFSTSEVYGSSDGMVLKEIDRLVPRTPYAAAKASCDFLTQSYGESFDIDYTIIRPFNNYGPRKQVFWSKAGIIPTAIRLLSQRGVVPVYGDGSFARDFVFVSDTVMAVLAAWKSGKCRKETINITNGNAYSVLEIIKDIGQLMGVEPKIRFLPSRDGDVSYLCGDGSKAKELIKFTPQVQWLDGLKKCIDYYSIL